VIFRSEADRTLSSMLIKTSIGGVRLEYEAFAGTASTKLHSCKLFAIERGMQKTEIVAGLPWLHTKPERAIFLELGFACVYAVGPTGGRPLRISWAKQLGEKLKELQPGCWKELQVHDVAWTVGDMLAVRLLNETTGMLDKAKRRLAGDWFDVTP